MLETDIISISQFAQVELSETEMDALKELIVQGSKDIDALKSLISIDDTSEIVFRLQN